MWKEEVLVRSWNFFIISYDWLTLGPSRRGKKFQEGTLSYPAVIKSIDCPYILRLPSTQVLTLVVRVRG
jgi:hypothetical protein